MTGRYYVQDLRERDVVEFDDVGIEVREHKHSVDRAAFWRDWQLAGAALPPDFNTFIALEQPL